MRSALVVLLAALLSNSVFARPTNTGYSGAPGTIGTCASTCHGVSGGTVEVFGFPTAYTPSQEYTITIRKLSGSSIKNFNSSIRIGSGSQNAGTLAAGQFTGTYTAPGESRGIHMTSLDHDSATFRWTAPTAGTGTVRLYLGAHQGERNTGPNSARVMVSTETPPLPGLPSNPVPANLVVNVPVTTDLVWTAGMNVDVCDLRFGLVNPPPVAATNLTATTYHPASPLLGDTVYFWQCIAHNSSGITEGPLWQFRTVAPNGVGDPGIALPTSLALGPVYPNPFNAVVTVPFVLPQSSQVDLSLYDINGRLVAQLVNSMLAAGDHQVQWSSEGVGSGVYLLRLTAASKTITTKAVALK